MKPKGWRSKATLAKALRELCKQEFLVVTRQGGRHKATLYGLTWFTIDHCRGKLDLQAPTDRFLQIWASREMRLAARNRVVVPSLTQGVGQISADCPTQ